MEWGSRICQQQIEKLQVRVHHLECPNLYPDEHMDAGYNDGWQGKAAAVDQFAASEGFRQAASLDIPYDDLTPEVACAVKLAVGDIND